MIRDSFQAFHILPKSSYMFSLSGTEVANNSYSAKKTTNVRRV